MNAILPTTITLTPETREDLNVLLRAENRVRDTSNTSGIAQAIHALLALEEGSQEVPKPVSDLLAQPWAVNLEDGPVQGGDLAHAIKQLLETGVVSRTPCSVVSVCRIWLGEA